MNIIVLFPKDQKEKGDGGQGLAFSLIAQSGFFFRSQ
jgi:hypothetical protein